MIVLPDILAAKDPVDVRDWIAQWWWLGIMVVLWVIGKVTQSAARKQAEQRQAEKDRQAQLPPSQPAQPSPVAAPETSAADQRAAARPEPTATDEIAETVFGAMGLTHADVEYRRRHQRAQTYRQARDGAAAEAETSPPPPPPPPPPAQRQELGAGVGSELQRQQRRLQMVQQQRVERLSADMPSEANTAEIEARLLSIDSAPRQEVVRDRAAVTVDLHRRDQLRKAIIYHEIFSSPIALRQGSEMWDM